MVLRSSRRVEASRGDPLPIPRENTYHALARDNECEDIAVLSLALLDQLLGVLSELCGHAKPRDGAFRVVKGGGVSVSLC